VVYNAAGQFNFYSDHLGSFRFASSYSNRTMYFDLAHAPFGEPYATSGSTDFSFTGQRQDTVAGLYDFPAREYSIQGRWTSPDPAGLAAVDPSNPQSWNRYAYVLNNPLRLVDPTGLVDCIDGHYGCNCNEPDGDCTNDFYGADKPGNGCRLTSVTCGGTNSDKEIAQNIAAENPFSSTVANALFGAQADYYNSVEEADARFAAQRGEMSIIVHCSGPGDNSITPGNVGPSDLMHNS
jgi:RHS repeat-associated protein